MTIKNTKQTLLFPAHLLLPEALPDSLRQLTAEYPKLPDEGKKSYEELFDKDGQEHIKDALKNLNVKYPWDAVPCTLTLGILIYDCCNSKMTEPPKAPIAAFAHQKKYQDLATACMQDEFEIPEWADKTVREVLVSDTDWNKVQGTVQFTKEDGSIGYLSINNEGLKYYSSVILEAIKVFS
jgi:hypothetical protein